MIDPGCGVRGTAVGQGLHPQRGVVRGRGVELVDVIVSLNGEHPFHWSFDLESWRRRGG